MPSPNSEKKIEKSNPCTTDEWRNDPWYTRSEEFYQMTYRSGKCRFCGKIISTKLDICACPQMKIARGKFKRLISQENYQEKIEEKNIGESYNPDKFIEQDLDFF